MISETIYVCPNYNEYKFNSKRIWRSDGKYEPFVYIIEEIDTGMKYIGSRTAKNCLHSDLGSTYFTSSKIITWNKDEFKILNIIKCASNHDAIILEILLIKENNAVKDKNYYNRCCNGVAFNISGIERSHDTRKKISLDNKEFYESNDHHMKGKCGHLHNNYGKKLSEQTRKKMSDSRRDQKRSPHTDLAKMNISNGLKGNIPWNKGKTGVYSKDSLEKMSKNSMYWLGKKHTKETLEKMSNTAKNRKKKQCPYCKRYLDPGNYAQFHGEKCKYKGGS